MLLFKPVPAVSINDTTLHCLRKTDFEIAGFFNCLKEVCKIFRRCTNFILGNLVVASRLKISYIGYLLLLLHALVTWVYTKHVFDRMLHERKVKQAIGGHRGTTYPNAQ